MLTTIINKSKYWNSDKFAAFEKEVNKYINTASNEITQMRKNANDKNMQINSSGSFTKEWSLQIVKMDIKQIASDVWLTSIDDRSDDALNDMKAMLANGS